MLQGQKGAGWAMARWPPQGWPLFIAELKRVTINLHSTERERKDTSTYVRNTMPFDDTRGSFLMVYVSAHDNSSWRCCSSIVMSSTLGLLSLFSFKSKETKGGSKSERERERCLYRAALFITILHHSVIIDTLKSCFIYLRKIIKKKKSYFSLVLRIC